MTNAVELLRANPQIIIFFTLAIGYMVGKVKMYNFTLGSTAGVLLVALVLGQIDISIPQLLESIMFALFIFCIGYKVGPEFFSGLKKDGIKYVLLSVFVAVVGLITAYLLGKLFDFDPGTTAGLLGGAMTQSTIVGTASEAIRNLPITAEAKALLNSNVAVAYAITYVFGTAGLVIFFKLVPRFLGIDLKKETKNLESDILGNQPEEDSSNPEQFAWNKSLDLRIYAAKKTGLLGKTIAEIEELFPKKIAIDNIKRDGKVLKSYLTEKIQTNDLIAVVAQPGSFLQAEEIIGPEVVDEELGRLMGEVLKIFVLNKKVFGKTLGEISKMYGCGCFFKRLTRNGNDLAITNDTVVKKHDELEVVGSVQDVEHLVKSIGYPERPSVVTDLALIGFGCALGTLLGLLSIEVKQIQLTLGVGGGILVSGLICGWLHSRHPTVGMIPDGAHWVLTDLGLNLFIACVGLVAGPKAWHALQSTGPSLFFAGMILTLTPMVLGVVFGRYILKMNPVLLFGALTGAGTITAALNAVKEESGSSLPTIGYTVPYAIGNVLLTIWGMVIVYLIY